MIGVLLVVFGHVWGAHAGPEVVASVLKDSSKCSRCHNNTDFDNPNMRYAFQWKNDLIIGRDCADLRKVHDRFDKHLTRLELDGAPDLQKLIAEKRFAEVAFILKIIHRTFELTPGKIPYGAYEKLRDYYATSPENRELIETYVNMPKPTAHIVNPEMAVLTWIADPKNYGIEPDDIRIVAPALGFPLDTINELIQDKEDGKFKLRRDESKLITEDCVNHQTGIFTDMTSTPDVPASFGEQ